MGAAPLGAPLLPTALLAAFPTGCGGAAAGAVGAGAGGSVFLAGGTGGAQMLVLGLDQMLAGVLAVLAPPREGKASLLHICVAGSGGAAVKLSARKAFALAV